MASGIYVITSPNGRAYIGSSKNLAKRKKQHFYELKCNRHHCAALQNAWNKYGEELKFVVIQICDEQQLLANEQFWIDNARHIWKRLYNGSMIAGRIEITDEVRAKMSAKAKNRKPVSEETRQKLSEAGKGRKLTENHINILRNRKISDNERKNRSKAQKGRIITEEHRRKISETLSGKSFHTKESKEKISEALRQRPPISDDTRNKLKLAQADRKRKRLLELGYTL